MAEVVTVSLWPRIMVTSSVMLECHYGTLMDTAHDAILSRLGGGLGMNGARPTRLVPANGMEPRAGDGARTHDPQLGKPVQRVNE